MRKYLQKLLRKPVLRLADKYSSRPDPQRVQDALTNLFNQIAIEGKKGKVIEFNSTTDRFIILSDQHKGTRNGSDDFAPAERNYLAALDYYYQNNFFYINL